MISTDDKNLITLSDEEFFALIWYLQRDYDSFYENEESNWDDFESEDNFSGLVD